MPNRNPMICRGVLHLKITARQTTTGHGRATSTRFPIRGVQTEVQHQGIIQGRFQNQEVQIIPGHIIPHPGQAIVFRNPSNRKPTQARGGRAEVIQAPCVLHPVILHLQGHPEVFRPGHPEVVPVAVRVVAGRPAVHQEVEVGEVDNILHPDIYTFNN